MKKCKNCNALIREKDKYCRNCGNIVLSDIQIIITDIFTWLILIGIVFLIILFIASYKVE